MRTLFRILGLSAVAAFLILPGRAQTTPSQSHTTPNPAHNEDEANALFQRFLETYETDQSTAYKIAKECVQKYPQESDQIKYLKRWVDRYDARMKVLRKAHLKKLIEERSFTEAFALGREIVASEPQDVGTLFTLIDGGLFALSSGNTTFVPDASDYAKRALKLIESNRAWPESRGKNLGWLNYTLGIFLLTSAPTEAANYLYKAMQFEPFNLDASIYALLADALLGAQYIPIQQEFEARFKTYAQKLSLQAEPLRAKLNLAADHLIQALARAVALAGSNAKFAQAKAVWLKDLTELYKFRNSGYETGLSEYIEAALDKPLRSDILRF